MQTTVGTPLNRAHAIVAQWLSGETSGEEHFENGLAIEHCEHGLLITHNGHAVGIAHHVARDFAFTRSGYNCPEFQTDDADNFFRFLVDIVAERLDSSS